MKLKNSTGRPYFWQWDLNQKLIVEDDCTCKEVHFCNRASKTSLVCLIEEVDGERIANVPNILLQADGVITAYLCSRTDDGGETRLSRTFQVRPRTKPESYVYTETEVLNYHSLAAQIQQNKQDIEQLTKEKLDASELPEAVNDALAQAKASGEFKGDPGEPGQPGHPGKTPIKGEDYFTDADKQEIAELTAPLVNVPEGGGVQPDWNQNDPTAPDYVKNRPFYTGKPVETTILTATYDEQSDNMETNIIGALVVGETYVVEYNGVRYDCVAWDDGGPCLGNGSLWDIAAGGDEPFVMWSDNGELEFMSEEFGSYTVTVSGIVNEVHKIDPKYLPVDIQSSLAVSVYDITKFISIDPSWGSTSGVTKRLTKAEFNELIKALHQAFVFYGHSQVTGVVFNLNSFQFYCFQPGSTCAIKMITGNYDSDTETLTCDSKVTYYELQPKD